MSRHRYFTPPQTQPRAAEDISIVRIIGMGGVLLSLFSVLVGRLWLLQMVRGEEHRDKALSNRSRAVRTTAPRGVIKDSKGRTLVDNTTKRVVFLHPDEVGGVERLLRIVDPARLIPPPKEKPAGSKKPLASPAPTPAPVPLTKAEALRELDKKRSPKKLAKLQEQDKQASAYLDLLAKRIEVPREELEKTIRGKISGANDPIPIREGIDQALMARIYELQDNLPGVSVEVVPMRSYPFPNRATHVLGFTAQVNPDDLKTPKLADYPTDKKYRPGDLIGRTGLEMQYDAYLRGTLGSERFEVDGRGRRRKEMGEVPAKAGDTLVLALDARVQEAAEKALGGNPGAVVAIDPRNGHILAMASGPTYDLNLRTRPMTTAESDMLNKDKVKRPLLNRTIARFPPGSTFKIITMAAGLATGKLPGGVDCHGSFPMGGGKPKKCHGTHGSVSPTSAFAQSCDIFYYKAGERIGDVKLAEWAGKFGLGKVTGLDFPYEKAGTIPTKKWVTEELKEGWWRGNLYDMAIGQGYDEATPLQIALVAATIANGGTIWQPHLVDRVVDSDDPKQVLLENKPVELGKLGLSKDHIGQIQRAMRSVVESGTGKAAAVSGIEVYGKTGTAETGVSAKTHGWFTGYAARRGEAPSIAVCVFREALKSGDHYHGGDVCAPAAHHVIETYFSSEPTTPPVPKPTPAPSRRRRSR